MEFSQIKDINRKYTIATYPRRNLCFVHGDGNLLYDTNERAYVDFVGDLGECCLGYNNISLTEAVKAQSEKLLNCSNAYYSEEQAQLAKTLCDGTAFKKVCFCSSILDTLAIVATMIHKYCPLAKDLRKTILVVTESKFNRYSTMQDNDFAVRFCSPQENSFRRALDDDVCAVIFAPIQVERGIKIHKYEFLLSAYAACKSRGALMVCDETGVGIGRTGKMFAFEQYGIQPDIVLLARGMCGGIPLAAVLARGEIAGVLSASDRINTFRTSSLACAAALVVTNRLKNGGLEEIEQKGELMLGLLSKLKKHNFVVDIRGKGLLAGIELIPNLKASDIVIRMERAGYLIDQTDHNTLRLTPPFTITTDEITRMYETLAEIFANTNL